MPLFEFEAITYSGKTERGTIEGESLRAVKQLLMGKELVPVAITQVLATSSASVFDTFFNKNRPISSQDLSALNEKENTQIVEEVTSFPKLFSEDENLKDISNNKETSSQFFRDLGHDLTDDEKADLEIPAFLRRQTN
jgi:hypothetical protein